MKALAIAATGMSAQQTNVDVIANNIANINTTGFKRARAEFTDLMYQAERTAGVANRGGGGLVPEGAQVGLGVRTAAVRNLHLQGTLVQTGNTLDLAMNGHGWFRVLSPDGETLYTRAGSFNKNANGELVTADGYQLQERRAATVRVSTSMCDQPQADGERRRAPTRFLSFAGHPIQHA